MTNDELKALCESNAKAIASLTEESREYQRLQAKETQQQRQQTAEDIDTLLGAVSSNEVACRELRQSIETNENRLARLELLVQSNSQTASANAARFDVLLADAQRDRQAVEKDRQAVDRDRAAWQAGFTEQMNELRQIRLSVRSNSDRIDNLEQAS